MAAIDILRRFTKVQPKSDAPDTREFVKMGQDLEAVIGALYKFCQTAVPSGVVVGAKLTAAQVGKYFDSTGLGVAGQPWEGWAICNGNNGTDPADGKFLRFSTSASGGTGGSDTMAHTHDVDIGSFNSGGTAITEAQLPAHNHGLQLMLSGGTAVTPRRVQGLDNVLAGSNVDVDDPSANITGNAGSGQTHLHTVDPPSTTSSAASNTENRPAYREWVPVMRL